MRRPYHPLLTSENQPLEAHERQVHPKGCRIAYMANPEFRSRREGSGVDRHAAVPALAAVIEPFALATLQYRRRKLTPPPQPAKHGGGKKARRDEIFEMLLAPLMSPDLILFVIFIVLALAVLLPLAAVEFLAQLVVGGVLAAARALGWARYRVDVIAQTGRDLHSETVLLMRDGARELVGAIRAERQGAEESFRPDIDDRVEVRVHRSIWQSGEEWV